ncbi:S-layer homology domain-containing protein [Psychrobacillus sp. FSL H8-0483]|uniref:S-layer homology domain-containing protein n=1 Tax=Psychrobacillus sp. FSL H8-0483 TaxID=2921389 RepID=UPI003159EA47
MKQFMTFIVAFLLTIPMISNAKAESNQAFSDLKGNSAAEAILYLHDKHIISGYPDGTFRPNEPITRAQAAAMLLKALDIEVIENPTVQFKDVTTKSNYYSILATINEKGIIRGENGYMRPGETTSRAQMAAILRRAFNMPLDSQPTFTDVSPAHWAYSDINSIAKNRVASGYPDGSFKPSNIVTRAHFSAFLARAMEDSMKVKAYKSFVGEIGSEIVRDGWKYTIKNYKLVKINQQTNEEIVLLSRDNFEYVEGHFEERLGRDYPIILYNNDLYIPYQRVIGMMFEIPSSFGLMKTTIEGGKFEEIKLPFMSYNIRERNMYVWNDRIYYTVEKEPRDFEPSYKDIPNVDDSLFLYSLNLSGGDLKLESKFSARFIFEDIGGKIGTFPYTQNHKSVEYEHSTIYYFNKKGVFKYSLLDKKTAQLSSIQAKDMIVTDKGLEIIDVRDKKHILKK